MKLHAFYENGRLLLQEKSYLDEGWIVRYDEAKPSHRWELLEVPLCAENRLYGCYQTLEEAMLAKDDLT